MLERIIDANTSTRMDLSFELREPEDLLALLAHSAAKLFTEADRSRVRRCGQCVLHFLDTIKNGPRPGACNYAAIALKLPHLLEASGMRRVRLKNKGLF